MLLEADAVFVRLPRGKMLVLGDAGVRYLGV